MGLEDTCLKSKGWDCQIDHVCQLSFHRNGQGTKKKTDAGWDGCSYNLDGLPLGLANSVAMTTYYTVEPHAKALQLLKTGADLHAGELCVRRGVAWRGRWEGVKKLGIARVKGEKEAVGNVVILIS